MIQGGAILLWIMSVSKLPGAKKTSLLTKSSQEVSVIVRSVKAALSPVRN